MFERWCALLITTWVFQKGEKFFAVASVVRVVEAQEIFSTPDQVTCTIKIIYLLFTFILHYSDFITCFGL